MITKDSIQQQFEREFPPERIHAVRALIDLAYESADTLYRYQPNDGINLLRATNMGKEIWADILRASIAYSAKIFCEKGILPYTFETQMNCAHNCHHLRLYNKDGRLYFARTQYNRDIPRKALYRVSDIIQTRLFDEEASIKKIETYAATYGDGGEHEFRYGRIGIPGEKDWIHSKPLEVGGYQYPTKKEENEILVQLDETYKELLRRDEKNNGGIQ